MKQKRILTPTSGVDSWKNLLADPEKHWREDFSAHSIAVSWENTAGIPEEIKRLFNSQHVTGFSNVELALAIPEYKVSLPGGTRPSQNDVFALLTSDEALSTMAVEGKAREDFDVTVDEWKQRTSEKGINERFSFLLQTIGLTNQKVNGTIRYQLLHRLASSIIEAKRFHAKNAIMVVQSFAEDDSENHYPDFEALIKCFGQLPKKEKLIFLKTIDNIKLYAAWVYSPIK